MCHDSAIQLGSHACVTKSIITVCRESVIARCRVNREEQHRKQAVPGVLWASVQATDRLKKQRFQKNTTPEGRWNYSGKMNLIPIFKTAKYRYYISSEELTISLVVYFQAL